MIRLMQRHLIIPRGDTGSFSVPTITAASQGDVAVFTIFDCLTRTKVFQKIVTPQESNLVVEFTHNDTVNLPPGRYVWDIKFYQNPQYADGELVNGEEIDSYYAGYNLPDCEIRETGDDLLTSDGSPSTTLTPESLDILSATLTEVSNARDAAVTSAENAASSASQVETIAQGIPETINEALTEAKESGEFDGPQGPQGEKGDKGDTGAQGPQGVKGDPGDDYVLTQTDKAEIAGMVDLSEIEGEVSEIGEDVAELKSAVGDLDNLETTEKSNLVAAINEVAQGGVEDGSLTEEKFTDETKGKVLNNYVTPEMFGAKGDGSTDDTQAIQDMFASSNTVFVFSKKTYLVDGAIDVTKACEIYFDNTELLAKKAYGPRDFEYILGFKHTRIKTYGRVQVSANTSANIGIFLSEAGDSTFDYLAVGNARIWGIYVDRNSDNNNSITFNTISAVQCGFKATGKAKYKTNKSLDVTDITGGFTSYPGIVNQLFDNSYLQTNLVVDDSLYTVSNVYNRVVYYSNTLNGTAFALDENDATKAVFTLANNGMTVAQDYADGEDGRQIFIPIGGGIFMQSLHSEGVVNIGRIITQSNPLGLYFAMGYGGNINVWSSEFDTIVMHNESMHTNINYAYIEGNGSGYTNLFGNAYDRIIQFSYSRTVRTYIHNPFLGLNRVPFMQGNVVNYLVQSNIEQLDIGNLTCPDYLSQTKGYGLNVKRTDNVYHLECDEYTPRNITIDANGFAWDYTIRLNLLDLNNYRGNRFEPLTLYIRRRTSGTSYDSCVIDMNGALVSAGYTIRNATNDKLTIKPSDYGNFAKITIVLLAQTKEFVVHVENADLNLTTSLSSASTDTEYPSAKCVYDMIGDVETLLAGI